MIETFLGLPQKFKNLCTIYPPTVNDMLREETKGIVNILTISQEEIEDLFVDKVDQEGKPINPPTVFEYFLVNCMYNKKFEQQFIKSFEVYIHEPITILYEIQSIIIGDLEKETLRVKKPEDYRILNKDNFFEFQNAIRCSLGDKPIDPPKENEDPRIKRMKAKARYRDRIKAKKGLGISFEETLVSICCMGIGLNPLNIGEISYAATKQLVEKYQQKERYDIDIKSLLAGADSKKIKPKYWMNKNDN